LYAKDIRIPDGTCAGVVGEAREGGRWASLRGWREWRHTLL